MRRSTEMMRFARDVQFPLWEVDMVPEPEPTKEEVASEQSQLERIRAMNLGDEPVRRYLCSD